LSPAQFEALRQPTAVGPLKSSGASPTVPVIYFANGGSAYLELQRDMPADMMPWTGPWTWTRNGRLGEDVPISGNLDPTVLFGSQEQIEQAVRGVHRQGGRTGQQTPEFGHGVGKGRGDCQIKWLVDE
jgi:uroporphyrinogen-III decarboxylase